MKMINAKKKMRYIFYDYYLIFWKVLNVPIVMLKGKKKRSRVYFFIIITALMRTDI